MPSIREDYFPQYKENLIAKVTEMRKIILSLSNLDIPALKNISSQEFDLMLLSVINSIKGGIVAKAERSRMQFVEQVFLAPAKKKNLLDYQDASRSGKCDFIGHFREGPTFGLEVKGGEGNSVTLLERPENSEIFIVWSHLDVMSNTPESNMKGVLGRIVKHMINKDEKRHKVDFLVFYDRWYRDGTKIFRNGPSLPDVFVFPTSLATISNPHPTLPAAMKNDIFVNTLMEVTANTHITDDTARRHIWYCDIELSNFNGWRRTLKVFNGFDKDISFKTKAPCKPVQS